MKLLKDILYKAGLVEVIGSTEISVSSICFDSRKAGKDSLFIAVRGTQNDGHKFILQVVESGTTAVVCEELPKQKNANVTYIKVKTAKQHSGSLLQISMKTLRRN